MLIWTYSYVHPNVFCDFQLYNNEIMNIKKLIRFLAYFKIMHWRVLMMHYIQYIYINIYNLQKLNCFGNI